MIILGIIFLIILISSCIITYKSAEVHELHKIRAAFEDKRHVLSEHYEHIGGKLKEECVEEKGKIEGLGTALEILDELEHLI